MTRISARLAGWRGLLLAAAIAWTGPAPAQIPTADSAGEPEIVVEGRKERQQQIRRFVGSLTEAPIRGQIARFEWEICPVALGMPDAQNRLVTERMRRVAASAGLPLAQPGCDANAILIVTPDKPATMRMLREEYPQLFRTDLGERIRLNRAEPVSAWQIEGRRTADGQEVGVGAADMGTYYLSEVTTASSRIRPATRPHFKASILVIDHAALRGLTTVQLADYAAMRVFARTDPERLDETTVPTILKAVDTPMGQEVPMSLTQWDLGLLRALYGSAENRYAEQQRREMRQLLERDLDRQLGAPDED